MALADMLERAASRDEVERYIRAELSALCAEKGWTVQVRRSWSARELPASVLKIGDHEWKLIPKPTEGGHEEGRYFVLRFDSQRSVFVLTHDTHRVGAWQHWVHSTYTEIGPGARDQDGAGFQRTSGGDAESYFLPPPGTLAAYLSRLTATFKPNAFSLT